MDSQRIHALLPLDGINANDRSLAGEFDRSYNGVELRYIKIALELIPRLPFLDKQHSLALVEVCQQTRRKTTRRYPRRFKDRPKCPQHCGSNSIRRHDFHREYNQRLLHPLQR